MIGKKQSSEITTLEELKKNNQSTLFFFIVMVNVRKCKKSSARKQGKVTAYVQGSKLH